MIGHGLGSIIFLGLLIICLISQQTLKLQLWVLGHNATWFYCCIHFWYFCTFNIEAKYTVESVCTIFIILASLMTVHFLIATVLKNWFITKQGFFNGQAHGKLSGSEDDWACLIWSSRGKLFFERNFAQHILAVWKPVVLLKTLIKPPDDGSIWKVVLHWHL